MPGRNAWYGCRRDTRDARDRVFKMRAVKLPPAVDLRDRCPDAIDQGELGSCVWNALTMALRVNMRMAGEDDVPFSRLQGYWNTRKIEGTLNDDAGCEIRNGIKVAATCGVAVENVWPYDIAKFAVEPSADAQALAKVFRALTYERVAVGISSLKQALARGFPVIVGATLYDSFESDEVARSGIVPMPDLEAEGLVGGHAMLCVGYGQRRGYFTVRNSWGPSWADGGDCYLPERYLGSPLYGSDFWIVKTAGA